MKNKIRSQETPSLRCKCGHDKGEHNTDNNLINKNRCKVFKCTCQKFKAVGINTDIPKNKGCGNSKGVGYKNCGEHYSNEFKEKELYLCEKCEPKNHNHPEERSSSIDYNGKANNSSGSDSPHKKTKLMDKGKDTIYAEDLDKTADTLSSKRQFDSISKFYYWKGKNIKEFIKKLKDKLDQQNTLWGQAILNMKDDGKTIEHIFDGFYKGMNKGIDKLAGKELSNGN